MRVLVTGGAGFIGSHLVDRLLRDGHEARVLDDLSSGVRDRVPADAQFFEGDIRDGDLLAKAVAGCDAVLHEAAIASVPRSVHEPLTTDSVNTAGTLAVLVAARDAGVRRLAFASSSAVYGTDPEMPKRESMRPSPLSPYAVQKLAGEGYLRAFNDLFGIETVALRYFNVFGPRQDPRSDYAAVVPRFAEAAAQGREVTIYGDGEQTRDFVYIDDVVEANLRALEVDGAGGTVLNVASGGGLSVNALRDAIEGVLGRPVTARHEPPRTGDVRHSVAAVDAIRERLEWEARTPLERGLARTLESFGHSTG